MVVTSWSPEAGFFLKMTASFMVEELHLNVYESDEDSP